MDYVTYAKFSYIFVNLSLVSISILNHIISVVDVMHQVVVRTITRSENDNYNIPIFVNVSLSL